MLKEHVPLSRREWLLTRLDSLWHRLKLIKRVKRHVKIPYKCIIAVDPQGLVIAKKLASLIHVPLVYYSLELLLSYEVKDKRDRDLKLQEQQLCKKAAFVITQDKERAELLARDNDISTGRILCIPNSPLGKAERRQSDYLRIKYNISADKKIILHSGSIYTWTCILELIHSTFAWPADWVLVCHTRHASSTLNPEYLTALRYLGKLGKVIFSFDPLPQEEYPLLVQSADIGVAFYSIQNTTTYTQDNIRFIGLSSGKLAYYLQSGLPVLVNEIPSLRRLVTTYKCGLVVDDPADTHYAIKHLLSDYETYSNNAVECFRKEFAFEQKFNNVINAVDHL
jgi:glycosyltransferase involved in cell wall biosynthesis